MLINLSMWIELFKRKLKCPFKFLLRFLFMWTDLFSKLMIKEINLDMLSQISSVKYAHSRMN
jgi:hypothetical protein